MSVVEEVMDITWKPIDAGTMTGTSVVTGVAAHLRGRSHASFQIVWTGTAVGTMNFEVTNHPQPFLDEKGNAVARYTTSANTAATWTTLTNPSAFTALQPNGTAGSSEFGFADLGQVWIRPKYTNTSSTGTLNCFACLRR